MDERRLLLREILGELGNLHPAMLARIEERSGGYPLFLAEVAELLRENVGDQLIEDPLALETKGLETLMQEGLISERVPLPLLGLLQSRIDRLDERNQLILQSASVLGRRFAQSVLSLFEQIRSDLTERLISLKGLNYLDDHSTPEDTEWEYVHGLLRDMAYAMLPPEQRRELHGVVARGLESLYGDRLGEFAEVIAFHYKLAGDRDSAQPHILRAADRRCSIGAVLQALPLIEEAIEWLRSRETPLDYERVQLIRMLCEKGIILRLMAQYDKARKVLGEAYELALQQDNEPFTHKSQIYLAIVDMWQGRYDQADKHLNDVLGSGSRDLSKDRTPLTDVAQVTRGILSMRRGDLKGALETFNTLVEIHCRAKDIYGRTQYVDSLNNAGLILWQSEALDEAEDCFQRALKTLDLLRYPHRQSAVRNNLGILQEQKGNVREALHSYRQAAQQAREIGHLQVRSAAENNIANLTRRIEEFASSLQHAALAVELTSRLGDPSQMAQAHHNKALSLAAMNRVDEALQAFDKADAVAEKSEDVKEQAWLKLDRIILEHSTKDTLSPEGKLADRTYLQSARKDIEKKSWTELEPLLARAWAAVARDSDEVEQKEKDLRETAMELEDKGEPLEALSCWRLLEQIAQKREAKEAREYKEKALSILRILDVRIEAY